MKNWQFDHLIASQTQFCQSHQYLDPSPYLDLSDGYDGYCERRSADGSSVISQAARKQRKLEREVGPLRFESHTTAPEAFDALLAWKRAQLNRQAYVDVFRHEWLLALMRNLIEHQRKEFGGILSALYAGDQLLAVQFGIRTDRVISIIFPAYNFEFQRFSPGLLLHLELARWAADHGFQRIDLGRGENRMKSSLMSAADQVAVGVVELRPLHRICRAGWYGMRTLAHSSPVGQAPLRAYRRLKDLALRIQSSRVGRSTVNP